MGKSRIIILGWHFGNDITFNDNNNFYTWSSENKREIRGENYQIEYIIGQFCKNPICFEKSNHQYKLYLFAHPDGETNNAFNRINVEIKNIIDANKENEILIYLHDGPWEPNEYQKPNKQNVVVHIKSGGSKPIYGNKGILNPSKNNFTKENITNLPWDDFWDKLYINLEEKKNRLIRLWLPLAIDIQGLSEVKENKKQEYFSEIKEYYKKNKIDQSEVDEIINSIKDDGIKEDIMHYKKKYEKILKNIESNQNNLNKFYKKYVNNQNGENFFPSLLQKLIEKLDQQIKRD